MTFVFLVSNWQRMKCTHLHDTRIVEIAWTSPCLCLYVIILSIDIDGEFLLQTSRFVDGLLNSDSLVAKCIAGDEPDSAYTILKFVCDCAEQLTSGKLTKTKPMLQVMPSLDDVDLGMKIRVLFWVQYYKQSSTSSFFADRFNTSCLRFLFCKKR